MAPPFPTSPPPPSLWGAVGRSMDGNEDEVLAMEMGHYRFFCSALSPSVSSIHVSSLHNRALPSRRPHPRLVASSPSSSSGFVRGWLPQAPKTNAPLPATYPLHPTFRNKDVLYSCQSHTVRRNCSILTLFGGLIHGCSSILHGVARR